VAASRVLRAGALVLAVGGLVALAGVVVAPGQQDLRVAVADPRFLPGHLLVAIGSLLVLLGLPAAYGRAAGRMGVPGLLGFGGVTVGVALFGVFFSLLMLLVVPWVAGLVPERELEQGPPSLGVFFPVAGLVATAGAVLLGIAVARSRIYGPWPGYLLILAGAVQLITGALGQNLGILDLVERVADAGYFLALGWLGAELWSRSAEPALEEVRAGDSPRAP
jgi:hypothetical protein